MVTDAQFRRLMKLMKTEKTMAAAAAKAGMDEKTARKYRNAAKPPSELAKLHTWRTRPDPFEAVWPTVLPYLENNEGLQAKTLFDWLKREHPGRFHDGQLRTLQRRVKAWRALEGPAKEVMFEQIHEPGRLAQSDFTHMKNLGVTIDGQPFDHMLYHFTLTWSNWEAARICFSESFESLAEGLQQALDELGGVPRVHQTDSLSAAVHHLDNPDVFTQRYQALLDHYGMDGQRTQPRHPHENGDIEKRNNTFKTAVDQRLMLRGSRDFASREDYEAFLRQLLAELNVGRRKRLAEELKVLRRLPRRRYDSYQRIEPTVSQGSTITVKKNIYSVHSRLIGEKLIARVYAEHIDLYLGRHFIERVARLRGEGRHRINYRHVIDWLVRKPGAFERYRWHDELFPTSHFRMGYDWLKDVEPTRASKTYLRILYLAARENETAVDEALRRLIDQQLPISFEAVAEIVSGQTDLFPPRDVQIDMVDLADYDQLLETIQAVA
jgi:transposase InsO family protein